MNIVFVEPEHTRRSLKPLLSMYFPGVHYFETGDSPRQAVDKFKELDQWLQRNEGKTVVITTSTFDLRLDSPGSAYAEVTQWLTNTALRDRLRDNLSVIAHPSYEERVKPGYRPFDELAEACGALGATLFSHPKMEGPRAMLETIELFFDAGSTGKETRHTRNKEI